MPGSERIRASRDARVDAADGVQSRQKIDAPPRSSACAPPGVAARRGQGPPAKPEIKSPRGAREAGEVDREPIGGERADFVGPSRSALRERAISVEEPPDLREANARPRHHHRRRFFRKACFGVDRCLAVVLSVLLAQAARADGWPWDDRSLPAEERARMAVEQMTREEELSLVHGGLGAPWGGKPKPPGAIGSAGFVPGIPRLGIPPLQETDAELGVANPGFIRSGDTATAMPSDLALASSWDPDLARRQGEAVGAEARGKGFSVLLGGAADLIRDPRGGRNFEYFSEDPLLTGLMAGNAVAGVQSRHVIATVKHFALNAQETDRVVLDARIEPAAAREADLLAFEIAIEHGRPASVMCAYNMINTLYSCENGWLLNEVLKTDWRYPGFVLSDWGAVHSTVASALAGLDQESGEQLDTENFFEAPLARAVENGAVPASRLDDMARRIVGSIFASGVYDDPPRPGSIDAGVERSNRAASRARRRRSPEERSDVAAFQRQQADGRDRRPRRQGRAVRRRLIAGCSARRLRHHGTERGRSRRIDFRSVVAARSDPPRIAGSRGRI